MIFSQLNTFFLFLTLLLSIANRSFAQEPDSILINENPPDSIIDQPNKENKGFRLFKKNKQNEEEFDAQDDDEVSPDQINDTIKGKKKFKFSDLFKLKNNQDSLHAKNGNDSIDSDSAIDYSLFHKNRNDSTDTIAGSRPKRMYPWSWNKMNRGQQDSLLREWDSYDKGKFKEKKRYKYSRNDVDVAIKPREERNLYEKYVYSRARMKPFSYRKKLITRMNKRYRKAMLFERLDKSEEAPGDSLTDERRYQIVNNEYKRQAKRETIRKNNVVIKYDKKEDRLRRRYELSENEKMLLNKGKGMQLSGSDLLIHNKALRKQEKFSEKLLKLRRERSIALQNDEMQKHMKEKEKLNKKRDKARYASLFGKKKKKNTDKFDSYEYPKRHEK
jgi:hypothetical protein